jgi:hypothetical protein
MFANGQKRTISHHTGGGKSGQEELSFPRYKGTITMERRSAEQCAVTA